MEDAIFIRNLLPAVFAGEESAHTGSDIWLMPERGFLRGERYLIRAASGKGKSSLCAFLYGSRGDYSGTIRLDGRDLRRLGRGEILGLRRDTIAYLPQDMRLFGSLTALENIELKNRLTNCKSRDEILNMMDAVGVADCAGRPAGRLSIGQQQRVAIVRALCQPFHYLLLDEPVSHLDAEANQAAATLIDRETARAGAAVIVTSVGNDLLLPSMQRLNL